MILTGAPATLPEPFALRAADEGLLRQVLAQTRVARESAGPDLTGFFAAWARAMVSRLAEIFSARPSLAENLLVAVEVMAIAAAGLGIGLLVVALLRRVRALRGPKGAGIPRLGWTEAPAGAPTRDRLSWRREIEACLGSGDIAGALEALWWWLASSLPLEAAIGASWTTRELLFRARRPELYRAGAVLDALMYGRRRPSREDVADCLARFEERLA